MTAPAFRPDTSSRGHWFGSSGFAEDAADASVPENYARHLASYIRDDSAVVARVADRFGRGCVTRGDVIRIRVALDRQRAWWDGIADVGIPTDGDGIDFAPRMLAGALPPAPRQGTSGGPGPGRPPMLGTGDPGEVIRAVEKVVRVARGAVTGRSRAKPDVRARALAAALLRARGNSYSRIGKMMGGRDHTSIQYLIGIFFDRMGRDADLAQAWMSMAPCVTKAARSLAELTAMKRVRV